MKTTIKAQALINVFTTGVILALCACSYEPATYLIEGAAQGTRYHITYLAPAQFSPAQQAALADAVTQELNRLDQAISNYRPDSAIEQFNSQTTTEAVEVSAEIVQLIEIARSVNKASMGCYVSP